MNIADRIQHLRKTRGISQEELADKIGVSRQAVSKWESEQSLPDLEKIILISDFFEVTTDYLLKGIDPVPSDPALNKEKVNAGIFAVVGTALNVIGLIVAAMVWYEEQRATATAVGLILIVVGCMIFGIGMSVSDKRTRAKAKKVFWAVNVWILIFIPMSLIYNILTGGRQAAPYPVLVGSIRGYVLFWAVYIMAGAAGSFAIAKGTKSCSAQG